MYREMWIHPDYYINVLRELKNITYLQYKAFNTIIAFYLRVLLTNFNKKVKSFL